MGSNQCLTPLKGEGRTLRICVFDMEAENMVETYAVGFYDGERMVFFEGENHVEDFLTYFLKKKYESWYCFAHNGGKYDFLRLLTVLTRPEWKDYSLTLIPQGSRIVAIDVKRGKRVWHFRDSFAILPFGLRRLTYDFDVKHKKLELDFERSHETQDWRTYLEHDCKGLYEVLQKFQTELQVLGGEIGLTIASTALRTFRRRFLKKDIPTYHDYDNVVRCAYYGGRTEIFRMYAEPGKYFCYDINSMYPAVMYEGLYPAGSPVCLRHPTVRELEDRVGICYVEGIAPENLHIPLLPVHAKGKLFFPVGQIKGWYDIELVMKALELGYRLEIKKALVFPAERLFQEYVRVFYKMKKESTGARRAISKLLLNSLYGKFAERTVRRHFYVNPEERDLALVPFHEDLNIYTKESYVESPHVLPAISVHVTALAQLKLYEYFELVLNRGGELYYCDTDSFFTNVELPTSNKLGDIKQEYEFEEAIFLLPKAYAIKKRDGVYIKLKGFPPESRESLSFEHFRRALFQRDLSVLASEPQKRVLTFRESIRRNKPLFSVTIMQKQIRHFYDKRRVNSDFSTSPLVFTESDYATDDSLSLLP